MTIYGHHTRAELIAECNRLNEANVVPEKMTYSLAKLFFQLMNDAQRKSVGRNFELIREAGLPNVTVYDAFTQAVEAEFPEIEREMLREQPTEGRG